MQVIRHPDNIHAIADPELRRLIQLSADQLLGQFDPDEFNLEDLVFYIVVEPGDIVEVINKQLGFNILGNRWDGTRWGDPAFTPSWEILEEHGDCWYELVYMQGDDSGYGVAVFVSKAEGVDPDLLAMLEAFSNKQGTL